MPLRVDSLFWNENNVAHLWQSHRVTTDEVEEVVFGIPGEAACYLARRTGEAYEIYGETGGGRLLKLVGHFRDDGSFRVFHAMNMTDVERRRYRKSRS